MRKKSEYTNSPLWDETRTAILDRDDHACIECASMDRLEVHHLKYDDSYEVGADEKDLVTLCRICHHRHHWIEFLRRAGDTKSERERTYWKSRAESLEI